MLARLSVVRRAPQAFSAVRAYTSGRTEGSVAESKGFRSKEKAHEDQYIRQHEAAQLAKLKEQIETKKKELDTLEKEHENLSRESKA